LNGPYLHSWSREQPRWADEFVFSPLLASHAYSDRNFRSQPAVSMMNELERELAELMIRELNLEDIQIADVSPDMVLYGEGFGLDSIDILEIALLISKKYGFELRSDNPDNKRIFATLGALAAYVAEHRVR